MAGLLKKIEDWDKRASAAVYVEHLFEGHERLQSLSFAFLKLLELSGHGLIWIALAVYAVLAAVPSSCPLALKSVPLVAQMSLVKLWPGADESLFNSSTPREYPLEFRSDQCNTDVAPLALNLLMALIFDVCVVGSLKLFFRRARPHYNKDDMFATVSVDRHSFPSGHTTRAFMVAALGPAMHLTRLLSKLAYTPELPLDLEMTILLVWAPIVGVSRVFLGRHHVLDVVAGAIIGVLMAGAIVPFFLDADAACSMLQATSQWISDQIRR